MSRYYFHAEDGRCYPDETGVELGKISDVKERALKAMSEMSFAVRDDLWKGGALCVKVTDEAGLILMQLDLMVTLSPGLRQSNGKSAQL